MSITDRARNILARHGVDIDQLGDAPPIDVAAIMVDNATAVLDEFIGGGEHASARIEDRTVGDWVRGFLADNPPAPLLLVIGPVGTGKTSHAYACLRECLLGRARQQRTLAWQMTSYPKFNAAMRPAADDAHLAAYTRAEECELLILDDLGVGITSEWTADTLYRLVDERWSRRRATIITSNFTPEEMRQKLDPRVVSRIASGQVVTLKGRDRRLSGGRP